MSGGGVKVISSFMSDRFRPQATADWRALAVDDRDYCPYIQVCRCVLDRNWLDTDRRMWRNHGDRYNAWSSQVIARRQVAGPARRGGLAPAPRGHPRRGLSATSVFRPARPRPGQVRDGAAPPDRWAAGDRGRSAVRGQSPSVLRGGGRLRGAGDPWLGAQAPRPEAGPQMHRRHSRLRRTLAGGRGRAAERTAAGGRDPSVWGHDSRPIARHARSLDRAVVRRKKKRRPGATPS